MRRKKISSILVCLCYFFILLLFCGCSSSLIENYLFEYSILKNGTYEVSLKKTSLGYTVQKEVKKLEIPTFHKGKPVTKIADRAFHFCFKLEKITIPDSVTSIGEWAFEQCRSLTSVEIPDSVTSIGDYAFRCCTGLTSIEIPNSVTSIGEGAFEICDNLTSIILPADVPDIQCDAFFACSNLTNVYYEGDLATWCKTSQEWALYSHSPKNLYIDGELLTTLIVPEEVTEIGEGAFANYESLKIVVIHDQVRSIGNRAFDNCDNLAIYCEAERQPDSWNGGWNYSNFPVYWGYKTN